MPYRHEPTPPTGAALSVAGVTRRRAIVGTTMSLVTTLVLAGCDGGELPDLGFVPDLPEVPAAGSASEGAARVEPAGDGPTAGLLQRFYARHGGAPVWADRQPQARALIDAVLRARDHGLDPALFQAGLLQDSLAQASLRQDEAPLSPSSGDLVLSQAFLSYADALARGAVPVERRRPDETLAPAPIDVVDVLEQAMASSDPGAAIEALAPTTPTYTALREALQQSRSGGVADAERSGAERIGTDRIGTDRIGTGRIGTGRIGVERMRAERMRGERIRGERMLAERMRAEHMRAERTRADRVRAIEVNLERERWLPRELPADRVWVNVADERLVMYRADRPAFSTRVVVGEDVEKNQSPEFHTKIDASFYNPPWVIPADIAAAEILPKLTQDPDYLTRNRMVMLTHGEVEQLPGPEAGLGYVMFDMPNKFDVYLHDTPERDVFLRQNRRISHGCIRVQNPRELAALLMDQPVATVDEGIAAGNTTRNALPSPVPVFVVYQTAFVDTDGALQFRPDFYKRDAAIWRRLQKSA